MLVRLVKILAKITDALDTKQFAVRVILLDDGEEIDGATTLAVAKRRAFGPHRRCHDRKDAKKQAQGFHRTPNVDIGALFRARTGPVDQGAG